MTELALVIAGALLLSVAVQAVLAVGFMRVLARSRRQLLRDDECPKATVILCLRGTDPFLARCLDAILDQDYPIFQLRIVIDHPLDPARKTVEQSLGQRQPNNVVLEELRIHRKTCSLKCSSLVQAVSACERDVEFIAQLDADTIPHRSWLRELATALSDAGVGAATGNRWYMPQEVTFPALVRYSWNAAAVVQMFWYRIAWGGTLAVKTAVIRECNLIDLWSKAFCEDTMLFNVLRRHGWNVSFVPSLMMINRESCSFRGLLPWIQRQLLTARLYHPRWYLVVIHGLGTSACLAVAVVMCGWLSFSGQTQAAAWLAMTIFGYELAMFILLWPIERGVRSIARARNEPSTWLGAAALLKLLIAVPLTQLIYPSLLLGAMRMRRAEWRGVTYKIDGSRTIELIEYRPYQSTESGEQSTASL